MAARKSKAVSSDAMIADCVTSVVLALDDLESREDKLAALSMVVHLLTRDERPAPSFTPAPVLALPPPTAPDPLIAARAELAEAVDAEHAAARADLARYRRPPAGPARGKHGKRPLNVGNNPTLRRQAVETLEYLRQRGPATKKDVAEKFKISESGAYQRLVGLARKGRVNHTSEDCWEAVA